MQLVPMAQNVSRTERNTTTVVFFIGDSFLREPVDKSSEMNREAKATRTQANTPTTHKNPDPAELNPRTKYHTTADGALEGASETSVASIEVDTAKLSVGAH